MNTNYLDLLFEIIKGWYPEVALYSHIPLKDFYNWAINPEHYEAFELGTYNGSYTYIGDRGIIFFDILRTKRAILCESRFIHAYTKSDIEEWYYKDYLVFVSMLDEICDELGFQKTNSVDIFYEEQTPAEQTDSDLQIDGRDIIAVKILSRSKWM